MLTNCGCRCHDLFVGHYPLPTKENIEIYFQSINRPHKCPNCKGEGERLKQRLSLAIEQTSIVKCNSCEGKGIVWR